MAEFEREIICERVVAGIQRAKAKGKRLGRPPVDVDPETVVGLRATGLSLRDIAKEVGVSAGTVHKLLRGQGRWAE